MLQHHKEVTVTFKYGACFRGLSGFLVDCGKLVLVNTPNALRSREGDPDGDPELSIRAAATRGGKAPFLRFQTNDPGVAELVTQLVDLAELPILAGEQARIARQAIDYCLARAQEGDEKAQAIIYDVKVPQGGVEFLPG